MNEKTKHETLIENFDVVRSDISGKIQEISKSFAKTYDLVQSEPKIYSVRQSLVDYRRELMISNKDLSMQFKGMRKERLMQHKENKLPVLATNKEEREIFDEAYFAKVVRTINQFDIQLGWVSDSISTCDQIINGLSYHIKLAALLSR